MAEEKPITTIHAKVVAIIWFALLMTAWLVEGGHRPVISGISQIDKKSWETGHHLRLIENAFEKDMETFEEIRPYYNWATFWTFGQSNGLVVRGKEDWMYYRSLFNPPGEIEAYQKDFLNLFKLVERKFAEKGCRVYWLPVPEKGMIHPHFPAEAEERVAVRRENLLEFIARAKKKRLQVIDLLPIYEERARKGEAIFLPDDTHWGIAGMNVAIQKILETIEQDISLKPQEIEIKPDPIQRSSDLPNMLNFPQSLIKKHHFRRFEIPRVQGTAPPQVIVFGTSFSYSFGMADHLGQRAQIIPEDHAFAGLIIPDLLLAALDRLEHGDDLKPDTAIIFEFPYRLLNRTDDLSELKLQFQWQRTLGDQPVQLTVDPQKLQRQNLEYSSAWLATNRQPMLFVNEPIIQKTTDPKFLRIRFKSRHSPSKKTRLKVFYDLGKGFQGHIHKNFHLSNTHSWQTWLIPIKFKRQIPKRIRIDFMNQTKPFELAPIDIY